MKLRYDRLAVYLTGYLYAFVMVYLAALIIDKGISLPFVFLLSAVAYIFVNLVLAFKAPRVITAVLLVLSGAAAGFLYLSHKAQFISTQVNNIAEVCLRIYYGELIDTPELKISALVLATLSAIAASILIYLLFNRFFRFFLITASIIAIQIFAWFITAIESKVIIALICLLTVVSYFRHVYEKKMKSGLITDHKVPGSIMLFSIPAAVIPIVLIMMMPKNDLPIQWPWLDQKIMKAIQYIEQRFSYTNVEFFSLSTTGFNGFSERLGGPVRPSNTIVMDVEGDKRTYLRGAAYSWYENNQWAQVRNDRLEVLSPGENEKELAETRQGWLSIPVDMLFPNALPDDIELLRNLESGRFNTLLFPTNELKITYRNMTTRSVFIPLLPVMPIKVGTGIFIFLNENIHGIVIADDRLPSGSNYSVKYAQPMYGDPMLKQALTFSNKTLYSDALSVLNARRGELIKSDPSLSGSNVITEQRTDANGNTIVRYLNSDGTSSQNLVELTRIDNRMQALGTLIERSDMIYEDYTNISESVPERVKALALDITAGCANDYEKVVAIQNYLAKNYRYTLNASRIPKGRDFVDWFLFDDKRGYCTYFATAMTLLLRYNDIPARYVEGYVMPEDNDNNRVFTITNRDAHAWVEAYFEGFGWLTFEATPVYTDVMNYKATVLTGGGGEFGPQGPDLEELMRRYMERNDIPGYVPIDINAKGIDLSKYLKYLPLTLAGLILLMIVVNQGAVIAGQIRLIRIKNKKKVLVYYQMMLKWLEKTGYFIKAGESAVEYGKRIDRYYLFEFSTFQEISIIFSKVRYGDLEVTAQEIELVKNTARQLKRTILKELGIKRYIPLRRIFLGI